MKYVLFVLIDVSMYPFLLLLYICTWLFGKIKFVPLPNRRKNNMVCISEISSARKK